MTCQCYSKKDRYIVATSSEMSGGWRNIQGPYCLDCARARMHKRAEYGVIVAVFLNDAVKLLKGQYRYSVDCRDKSNWSITPALGGIINARESDWF